MTFSKGSILFSQVRVTKRAVAFMKSSLATNTNCYSTAITAYALTLVQSDSEEAQFAKGKLRSCAVFDAGTVNHS